ncbi:MAG: helix-turn-helix transcriptional regulator, partial [Paludibacteraceae bacterium]|nr:helix-turn-helix transcriptional regulator [Paludibacteraceae bacterium]
MYRIYSEYCLVCIPWVVLKLLGLGYSQEKLANMCEISNSTLSAYENSKKIPNLI